MNNSRDSIKSTFVKILIIVPAVVFVAGVNALAADNSKNDKNKEDIPATKQQAAMYCLQFDGDKYDKCMGIANTIRDSGSKSCSALREKAEDAKKEIMKACGEAGLGGETHCYESAKRCKEVSRDDDSSSSSNFNIFNSVSTALGGSDVASTQKKNQNGCPQFTGDQYRRRMKEINDELKDVKKEITDLQKESTDLEKDTQKDMQDTQKDIADAQKDMQKDMHDIDDDVRQQVADVNKSQSELKKQLSDNDQNVVKLRGQMLKSENDKASQLIALNDAAIKDSCVAAYEEKLNKYQSAKMGRSLSFSEMKSIKASLVSSYNTCIRQYQQQRIAIITGKQQEQAEIKSQMVAAQGDMEETQHSIDLSQTQVNEVQAAATTKKNEATQNMTQKIQTAQTSIQTAQSNMQKQQQVFQNRYNDLHKRQNELTAELNAMGTEPEADATMTPRKAASMIDGQLSYITAYSDSTDPACCDGKNGKDPLCKAAEDYKNADPNAADPQFKNAK